MKFTKLSANSTKARSFYLVNQKIAQPKKMSLKYGDMRRFCINITGFPTVP